MKIGSTAQDDEINSLYLESLGRFEDRGVVSRKGHAFAGSRVTAFSCIMVLAGESAESEEGNRLTGGE